MQSQVPPQTAGLDHPGPHVSSSAELPSRVRAAGHSTASDKKSRQRRGLVFGAVGVAVLLALAVAGFLMFGGNKSVEDTVADYVSALQKGDASSAYATFSTPSKATQSESQFSNTLQSVLTQSGGIKSITVEKVIETSSSATALYRVVTGLGEETWQMTLVKEDGKWVIDVAQLRQISNTYK